MSAPAPGGSLWSPQQRGWLRALGYALYRTGSGAAEDAVPEPENAPPREAMASVPRPHPEPAPRGASPAAGAHRAPPHRGHADPDAVAEAPATAPAPALAPPPTRRPAHLPDRLQLALLRASGMDPSDPATQAAMAQWPVERLRGDAAAKRAFWPQLRALRRRS
ncbi:hypothetical protein B1992_06690 [Pseudoxanthomonas broegbernensis]|uniref:Alanine acetyltransferase n=1 Tax=Pseudoxanthomonas broegbernensis TaxID=83619 RepID=A0A7V8GMX4_9GAMM|nr:hypothetical protein [Pseudoxanthomonas broegbernensis]KAF1686741.1 hypothetical protein B1992_06690 [Pseudoxanthomonas broegbernensis]MBB6063657.1 hypothetical protein [Pseudoxanthomonas broegbernensis]